MITRWSLTPEERNRISEGEDVFITILSERRDQSAVRDGRSRQLER